MYATKKPTGDPFCLKNVRRAKNVARDTFGHINAQPLGFPDYDNVCEDGDPAVNIRGA